MKSWKICWVSKVGDDVVDHDGLGESALIVKAADIPEAYSIALPLVMMKAANEGASEFKVYDVGIMEDDVF